MTTIFMPAAVLLIIILLLVLIFKRAPDNQASLGPQLRALHDDNTRLRDNISERVGILAQNAAELKNISGDMANFKNIMMGSKQARGLFGERQLEDLISGIMPPETYEFQCVIENGSRPDCVIKLPYPPGDMIIDSKFPLEGYEKMQTAVGENEIQMASRQFEMAVRTHIDAIASKYIIPGKTADNAMLFIRAESIFETLHRDFPDMIDYAARKKVFLVSPATLWATLNTIRSVLSDIKIKRVAGQIKKELELLLSDLSRLSERAGKVSSHFAQTVKDLEDLQISVNKITPRAEKLRELEFGD